MPKFNLSSLLFIATAILLFPFDGHAKSSGWQATELMKIRVLVDKDTISKDTDELNGAIEIKMNDGWHTYWRSPGDAGLTPSFDWEESQNLENVEIMWPAPSRLKENTLTTFGYKDSVRLPARFKLKKTGNPVTLSASSNILVCNEICVPQKTRFSLSLKKGDGRQSAYSGEINAAYDNLPHDGNLDDLKIENLVVGLDRLVVTVTDNRGLKEDSDVFIEIGDQALTAPPEMEAQKPEQGDLPRTARFVIPARAGTDNLSQEIKGKELTVTLINRGRALEKHYTF